jgi:hypothetical protein
MLAQIIDFGINAFVARSSSQVGGPGTDTTGGDRVAIQLFTCMISSRELLDLDCETALPAWQVPRYDCQGWLRVDDLGTGSGSRRSPYLTSYSCPVLEVRRVYGE